MDVLTVEFCGLITLPVFWLAFATFLYRMRCTVLNLNKIYILKIKTYIKILA